MAADACPACPACLHLRSLQVYLAVSGSGLHRPEVLRDIIPMFLRDIVPRSFREAREPKRRGKRSYCSCSHRQWNLLTFAPGYFNNHAGVVLLPLPLANRQRFDSAICPCPQCP